MRHWTAPELGAWAVTLLGVWFAIAIGMGGCRVPPPNPPDGGTGGVQGMGGTSSTGGQTSSTGGQGAGGQAPVSTACEQAYEIVGPAGLGCSGAPETFARDCEQINGLIGIAILDTDCLIASKSKSDVRACNSIDCPE
jgi:hypothetical protein